MQGVVLHKPSPNEATSSVNLGIKCPNDFAPVTGSVEAAEADMDTLHVPNFKAVQDILNTKTAGVSADMDTLHVPNFKAVQDILNTKTTGVESQHTPTLSDTVIDVMPTTSINQPDQPKRNFGESTGGSKESAIFDENGMETAPSNDVTSLTGENNLIFKNELKDGNIVSSLSSTAPAPKTASWKKRARVQTQNNLGSHIPVQRLKRKCVLSEIEEDTDTEDGEPCKKKACKDGGVGIHDSVLVEAVEQPHQSQ